MTAADLHAPVPEGRTTLTARIDHRALVANADAVLTAGAVVPLPADAYGHGFDEISSTLTSRGFRCTPTGVLDSETAAALFGWSPRTRGVLRLSAPVLGVKPLLRGEGVSYGYRYRAPADTRIALVVGGYAQGVLRSLGGRAAVVLDDVRHPIVGRVAMDVCVVEIGDAPISRGAEAVFLGDRVQDPRVDDWVAASGLTPAEIVTMIGLRANREHVR